MHLASLIAKLRRGSALIVLAAAVAIVTLGLSQCRMVGDQLTGVSVTAARAGSCLSQCAKEWNDSMRVENDLHVSNIKACDGDTICKAVEAARWAEVLEHLADGRLACQQGCQHQGSGAGGR